MAEFTIKQVKEMKIELDSKIMDLINDFEKETEVKIGYISIERKRDRSSDCCEIIDEDKGVVINIDTGMDLDI